MEKKTIEYEELKQTIHRRDTTIKRNKSEDKEAWKTHEVPTEGAQQAMQESAQKTYMIMSSLHSCMSRTMMMMRQS